MSDIFLDSRNVSSDKCAQDTKETQNNNIEKYEFFQYLPVECDKSGKVARYPTFAYDHVNLFGRIGYGETEGCVVDTSSELRNDPRQMTHDRCHQQLYSRIFQGGPNLRCGVVDPDKEMPILQGNGSRELAGVQYPCIRSIMELETNHPMPMQDCIKPVQSVEHTVEPWVRGGVPTRDFMLRQEFLESCGAKSFSRGKNRVGIN